MTPARKHLLEAGVAPRDADLASGKPVDTPAFLAVRTFTESEREDFLVLSGAPGSGKTTAAAFWLLNAQRHTTSGTSFDPSSRFVTAASLALLNPRFSAEDRRELERIRSVRWLVLDDLGTEPDDTAGLVRAIVDHRYGRYCRTVITTMLAVRPQPGGGRSNFESRYGAAMCSRIEHRGRMQAVGSTSLRGDGLKEAVERFNKTMGRTT